jgi:hypothetical protein
MHGSPWSPESELSSLILDYKQVPKICSATRCCDDRLNPTCHSRPWHSTTLNSYRKIPVFWPRQRSDKRRCRAGIAGVDIQVLSRREAAENGLCPVVSHFECQGPLWIGPTRDQALIQDGHLLMSRIVANVFKQRFQN